jgi:hypothetical protein
MLLIIGLQLVLGLDAQMNFVPHRIAVPNASSGALLNEMNLYSWGEGLSRTHLDSGRNEILRKDRFGAAGCDGDLDADGVADLVLHALPDRLVWLKGPGFRVMSTVDTGANFSDCLVTSLLGRRGILVTHRGMQVRFYEMESRSDGRWPYREIYSFYTASHQAGLVIHDVDKDGRPDLIAGNYWIRSPESFELPWRLFAINTYNDSPQAAHLRMAVLSRPQQTLGLLVSQAQLNPAKLALFTPPPDPRQLWIEERMDSGIALNRPAGLASADIDGDGIGDFVLAERGGTKPRVWLWRGLRDGSFRPDVLLSGSSAHTVFVRDINRDGHKDIILAGATKSFRLEAVPVK